MPAPPLDTGDRPLRICTIGNVRTVAVRSHTEPFAALGHTVAILSPVPGVARNADILVPGAGHSTAMRRAWSYAQMITLLHRWRPDIVLVYFAASPFNWLLPIVWWKPLFVAVVGGDVLFHQRHELSPARRAATMRLLQSADGVIARSPYMLAALPSLGERALITLWGIDLDRFDGRTMRPLHPRLNRAGLGLPSKAPIILSARRLVPVCGVANIVAAMEHVRAKMPEALLVVVDDEPDPVYKRDVLALIARLNLADRIIWLDAIAHDDMPALFALADVTVSVARSDGVSATVLESMAARTPVVVGNIPNYAGIFEDRRHCLLADPEKPESIAAAIVALVGDGELRTAVIEEAHALVLRDANIAKETKRIVDRMRQALDVRRPWRLRQRLSHAIKLLRVAFERDDVR